MKVREAVSASTRRRIDDLLTRVESAKLARERAIHTQVDGILAKMGLLG